MECTTAGFGIDSIDQTDLIPHSKNEKRNQIQDKGIGVAEFIESNPYNSCRARGLQYHCSIADDCTSEINKIRTVKSTPNKPGILEQNSELQKQGGSETLFVQKPQEPSAKDYENILSRRS